MIMKEFSYFPCWWQNLNFIVMKNISWNTLIACFYNKRCFYFQNINLYFNLALPHETFLKNVLESINSILISKCLIEHKFMGKRQLFSRATKAYHLGKPNMIFRENLILSIGHLPISHKFMFFHKFIYKTWIHGVSWEISQEIFSNFLSVG